MEYNLPSELVKNLNFGENAQKKVIAGVEKLAKAVKSTLGASGKCVIYEDGRGKPVITKDGVTVAQSVVLFDPVENIGATLIKESASNTVEEAGDGTTTATVLAESLIKNFYKRNLEGFNLREVKDGMQTAYKKVLNYLEKSKIDVNDDMLDHVATISCNNDGELGAVISDAWSKVGKNGVVLMENSDTNDTYIDIVDGIQMSCPLTSTHFITDKDKQVCELDNPLVLICANEIPNVRKIQVVLEYAIQNNRSILVVSPVAQQVKSAMLMNKAKGNIKVNIINLPGFGPTKQDTIEDLAILTGAKVINEELGDDINMITPDHLGEIDYCVTDNKSTIITTLEGFSEDIDNRIKKVEKLISKEKNGFIKKKLEERLSMLSGRVAVIKVGADSQVELKEKRDRVEDAIHATKAALQEGIVAGGGVALLNASQNIKPSNIGEEILLESITSPFHTILENAGIEQIAPRPKEGLGVNVVTGKSVNMVKAGIIDPVLVTKSALKNAVSVVSTIVSADCVISNVRADESN